MNEITKELKAALALISGIAVAGDAVDAMALAKQNIRMVIAELEEGETNG